MAALQRTRRASAVSSLPPLSLNSAILITFLAPETLHLLLLFPGLVTLDDFVSECGKSGPPLDKSLLGPLDPLPQSLDLLVELSNLLVLRGERFSEGPVLLPKEIRLAGLGSKRLYLRLKLCIPFLDCFFDLLIWIYEDLMFRGIRVRQ